MERRQERSASLGAEAHEAESFAAGDDLQRLPGT
jgi:hypothetical protein